MRSEEFWKIFENELKPNLYNYAPIFINKPVGGDGGFFLAGLFKNDKGIWCIEETQERSNHPYHDEFLSEEDAVKQFFNKAVLMVKRELRPNIEEKYKEYL